MTHVYIVLTPMGYILGVYANADDAIAMAKAAGDGCRISHEPVIGGLK